MRTVLEDERDNEASEAGDLVQTLKPRFMRLLNYERKLVVSSRPMDSYAIRQ